MPDMISGCVFIKRFASLSAWYTGMSKTEKIFATVDFPEPIPPVSPILSIAKCNRKSPVGVPGFYAYLAGVALASCSLHSMEIADFSIFIKEPGLTSI